MNEDLGNPSRTCFVASEIYPRRLNAKEVLIIQRDGEFIFPVTDGPAKLSGRNYEFQEPTLRLESTVRRDNLSGEFHVDREEFHPEETKDDEGINKDFWTHAEFHSSSSYLAFLNETPPRRNIRIRGV